VPERVWDSSWLSATKPCAAIRFCNVSRAFFERVIAEQFAFRRANGKYDNRVAFLEGLGKKPVREQVGSADIVKIGSRALVTCAATVSGDEGNKDHYSNVRLFVHEDSGGWKLLAWANEKLER
jgi:hypothetical protein